LRSVEIECNFVTLFQGPITKHSSQENFMPFRNTKGIVSADGDPVKDADVIMTAAALGLAASHIAETGNPIQFDMDPLDVPKEPEKVAQFQKIVKSMDAL